MSAVVLAALLLFRTGIAPQPEPLSAAWWWLRPAWWLACAVCLLPFVLAFRWAERPAGSPPRARGGATGDVQVVVGTLLTGGGLGLIAAKAFPVPGLDGNGLPTLGVALTAAGALLVWVDPFAPTRRRRNVG